MGNVKVNHKRSYWVDNEPCKMSYRKSENILLIKCETIKIEIPLDYPRITYFRVSETTDRNIIR